MTVSAPSSATPSIPLPQIQQQLATDGDSKVRTSHTSQVKDADGDYAQIKTGGSAPTLSSSDTLAAITNLKAGG